MRNVLLANCPQFFSEDFDTFQDRRALKFDSRWVQRDCPSNEVLD